MEYCVFDFSSTRDRNINALEYVYKCKICEWKFNAEIKSVLLYSKNFKYLYWFALKMGLI